jgi:hypothetical protein
VSINFAVYNRELVMKVHMTAAIINLGASFCGWAQD